MPCRQGMPVLPLLWQPLLLSGVLHHVEVHLHQMVPWLACSRGGQLALLTRHMQACRSILNSPAQCCS